MRQIGYRKKAVVVFVLFASKLTYGQQAGLHQLTMQMLRIVEQDLQGAAVSITPAGKELLRDLVRDGAASLYEQDALSEAVVSAEALANRLIDIAEKQDAATLTIRGTEDDHRAICPLQPFC